MSDNKVTFKKAEHLCSHKDIENLFDGNNFSAAVYPLRIVLRIVPREKVAVKMLVSVSKRHFKHAVDRNRVKRQVREAYRVHKQILLNAVVPLQEEKEVSLHVAFLWLSDSLKPSDMVEKRLERLLYIALEKLC